jgi:hypothetical protein
MRTIVDRNAVTGELHRVRRGRRKVFAQEPPSGSIARPARVAVMLALAHRIQRAIDQGNVRDQAEVARRQGMTRARLTQLLGLALLAPDLQERILFLEAKDHEPFGERALRSIARRAVWSNQRFEFQTALGTRALAGDRPDETP